MRLKKIIAFIMVTFLIMFCFSSFSVANQLVVTSSKKEVAPDEEFYIVIDTSNVEIDEFDITISNNFKLTTTGIKESDDIDVSVDSKDSKEIKFKVDKKDSESNKFAVYYLAPSQETNIEFRVSLNGVKETIVTTYENVILENSIENVAEEIIKKDTVEREYITLTESIVVSVKKQPQNTNSINNNIFNNVGNLVGNMTGRPSFENKVENNISDPNMKDEFDKEFSEDEMDKLFGSGTKKQMETEMMNMREKMTQMQEENTNLMQKIQSSAVTYQGSYNNYLESLKITDIEFKNTFHKALSTYFAEVDENTEDVTVKAVAEDSSAIVTIYGNKNLEKGLNKILINVTADDESVRTYRIYVTKK